MARRGRGKSTSALVHADLLAHEKALTERRSVSNFARPERRRSSVGAQDLQQLYQCVVRA